MKSSLLLFVLILFLCACHDEEVDKIGPVRHEQWFKDLQYPCEPKDICKTSIARGTFNGSDVYFVLLYGGMCDAFGTSTLYNEQGVVVKEYTMDNEFEFYTDVTDYEVIWWCD